MEDSALIVRDADYAVYRLALGPFGTNAYIFVCTGTRESILIDAPGDAPAILARLKDTAPRFLLLTHGHADHTGVLAELKDSLGLPLAAHMGDSAMLPLQPDLPLENGDTVRCGGQTLTVWHTPGHTDGSLCFSAGRCLFAGDTIFPGGPGRTDSPDDFRSILRSIKEKVFALPDHTLILPGHGLHTTVGKEKELYARFASRPPDPALCGAVTWLGS